MGKEVVNKLTHGQAGGMALFAQRGSEYFSKIAKKGHARRKRLERLAIKEAELKALKRKKK